METPEDETPVNNDLGQDEATPLQENLTPLPEDGAPLDQTPTEQVPTSDTLNVEQIGTIDGGAPIQDPSQIVRTGNASDITPNVHEAYYAALAADEELFRAVKDNIAMAFKDEYTKIHGTMKSEIDHLHLIANTAAENFLKLITGKK